MRDSSLFDKAVVEFFEPIAQKLALPFIKVSDGVYEIPSSYFIMRIRLDTGHQRGLNVLLRPASLQDFDENKPGECGIGCFIQFNGEDSRPFHAGVATDEDFLKLTQLYAQAAERFCVPYLLGQKNDFEAVKEWVRKKGEPELARIKQLQRHIKRNMPSVRQEWIVPEDEMPQ